MLTVADYQNYAVHLNDLLGLSYSPIAVRVYEDDSDIPHNALRPFKDHHEHFAYCQAVSLVKTQGLTIALGKEDMWCWKPLMAWGMVDVERNTPAYNIILRNCGIESADRADYFFKNKFPLMPRNNNRVIVLAPLASAAFEPDVILVYCSDNVQLRDLIAAIKRHTGKLVASEFDYMDSCIWSYFPTHYERDFRVTFPDPGETGRACCPPTEVILSVPAEKFEMVVVNCIAKKEHSAGRTLKETGMIVPDFPRPEFYNTLYEMWGLETGDVSWNESQRGYKI